ncbi:MAG TPA: GlsB/YeaQ/YmgE family stress response membrane protein [Candidatus Binataceae bacterium]
MIGVLIIGLIAGWLAGKLMRGSGYGIIADVLLGLIGAVIGSWLFRQLGIVVVGSVGFLAMATIGALVLVGVAHLLREAF